KMNQRKWLRPVIAAGILMIILNISVYALINNNGAGGGYGDGGDGDGEKTASADGTIESFIIEGAAYYMSANSDFLIFLKQVELMDSRGLDFEALNKALDSAVLNMKNAVETYDKLTGIAEGTPYDQSMQVLLKEFDYPGFAADNGLNPVIFNEAADYLKKGDITGILERTHTGFTRISEMLQTVKGDTALGRVPDISLLRQVNETFSRIAIFGSYVARVFDAVS
ncbi:MAG: hypothetical protein GY950_01995, partial [bacterium]|nr:hypothetical protein [bacterium]